MASIHNGMMRMYETFGNGGANTMHRHVDAPEGQGGPMANATQREWYRPLPPDKEADWSMRDNTNYMETGVLTALEMTAAFPEVILDNFYKKSRNSIESGKKDQPCGYLIPANQADRRRVALVLTIVRLQ